MAEGRGVAVQRWISYHRVPLVDLAEYLAQMRHEGWVVDRGKREAGVVWLRKVKKNGET